MLKYISIISVFLFSLTVCAEYRVYQYYVKNRVANNANAYLVTTSLDPVSYLAYNGGVSSISIDLLRTWICPGHTGHYQEYCSSPYESMLSVASNAKESK